MKPLRSIAAWIFCFSCFVSGIAYSQQKAGEEEVLTNETLVKLVKAGVGEDVILRMVDSRPGKYSVGSDAVIALKREGVSDQIISAVLKQNSSPSRTDRHESQVSNSNQMENPPQSSASNVPKPGTPRKLTVVARTHSREERDFTVTTPQTTSTNCNLYPDSVNCNSTTYGGGSQNKAIYRFVEVVTSKENGRVIQYTLSRTVRWVWNSMDWLNDGESFPAEIKGTQMFITARRGGNQGKKEVLKYEIVDIRPLQ